MSPHVYKMDTECCVTWLGMVLCILRLNKGGLWFRMLACEIGYNIQET